MSPLMEEILLKGVAYSAIVVPPWNLCCWTAMTAIKCVRPDARARSLAQNLQDILVAPIAMPIAAYLLGSYYLTTKDGFGQLLDGLRERLGV